MKKVLLILCMLCLSLPMLASVTEEYSVQNPSDPDIDKIIIIDRTTIEQFTKPVKALQQIRTEQKQVTLDMISDYNDLVEQMNDIIDACELPSSWKWDYMSISYTPTKP